MLPKKSIKTNRLATGAIIALLPLLLQAKGLYIVEPFSCEVALADYHHLVESTQANNPKFKQEQLERALEAVTQELELHGECGGVEHDAK